MAKNIGESYLFKEYEKSINLTNTIVKFTTTGTKITEEDIKENLTEIERRYYFSSKNLILNDFKNGRMNLMYHESIRFPNTLPAFLLATGNKKISCIVNLSNNMTKDKNGNYNIDTRMLFNLMQCGSILLRCYTDKSITSKTNIIKLGSSIYSKLFTKILNKMFSINISPEKQDIVIYLSSLFFINNVLDRNKPSLKEINQKYALENCKANSRLIIQDALYKFNDDDFKDINTFITAMAKNIDTLETLNTRSFVDNYILAYGPSMLFSLEYLPMFLYNIFSVVVGAFINNQNALENAVGKDIDELFKAFFY